MEVHLYISACLIVAESSTTGGRQRRGKGSDEVFAAKGHCVERAVEDAVRSDHLAAPEADGGEHAEEVEARAGPAQREDRPALIASTTTGRVAFVD